MSKYRDFKWYYQVAKMWKLRDYSGGGIVVLESNNGFLAAWY